MKNNIFRLLGIMALLLLVTAHPARGSMIAACLDHKGIDCEAGPQDNGKVLCLDGWKGSDVDFADVKTMCESTDDSDKAATTDIQGNPIDMPEGETDIRTLGNMMEDESEEEVELSEAVDEDNVVDVVADDTEDVSDDDAEMLNEEAANMVSESLDGESESALSAALEKIQAAIEAKIATLEQEAVDTPELAEKIGKRIEHLKELLAKLRAKIIAKNEPLAERLARPKNVPAVYEIRWGNLTSRQPCRLLSPEALRQSFAAGEIPEDCQPTAVEYTGTIAVNKGELKVQKMLLFEENDEVTVESGASIEFTSMIAGGWDGLVLEYIPAEEDSDPKTPVNITVSIGDLSETYAGSEVLGQKMIGNGHMISFRHLGRLLPSLAKADLSRLLEHKLRIKDKTSALSRKLDRIRLMSNVGRGGDDLEEAINEADEYNFDDTTATEVENEIEDTINELSDDASANEVSAKAKELKDKIDALKEKAKARKYAQRLTPFKDTDDTDWFTTFVAAVKAKGIISGYKDAAGNELGEYRPGNQITVAEILKIALESADKGKDESKDPTLAGAMNHWAKAYVAKAEELGLDLVEGTVDLNRPATRGEVVRLILEAFGVKPDAVTSTHFSDLPVSHPQAAFVEYAKSLGIVSGDAGKTTFRPDAPVNRAEAAKIANQALELLSGDME